MQHFRYDKGFRHERNDWIKEMDEWMKHFLYRPLKCFLFIIVLQLQWPIEPKLSQVYYSMYVLEYTKWGYWSFTITKNFKTNCLILTYSVRTALTSCWRTVLCASNLAVRRNGEPSLSWQVSARSISHSSPMMSRHVCWGSGPGPIP